MENYDLKADEVVLYKGDILLSKVKGDTELIVTNLFIVFITKHKRLFRKEEVYVSQYSIDNIKIWKEEPQIKPKGNLIEIFFTTGEIEFEFFSKKELNKFLSTITKLLTGKSKMEQNAEKVKNTIHMVDDTLGINSVETVGKLLKNGVVGSMTGIIGKGLKGIGNLFKKKK